ncbi:hypothetical protein HYV10_03425 [Candidatus Dependentiae bacterium]|nr:hypothetical protein [Candidatus Dependentiae bacterium]
MKKMIMVLLLTVPLAARYHRVTSSQEFARLVDNYKYSVACFIPDARQGGQDLSFQDLKDHKKYLRSISSMLQAAASKPEFKRFLPKDIGFIAVNVAAKRAQNLVKDYQVGHDPVCYAFNEGARDRNSRVTDPSSTKDLTQLLEDSAGDDLEKLLIERKDEQNQERQERIARYYAYGGFYPYGWGYSWGGSSYWAQPYWGWYRTGPCYW